MKLFVSFVVGLIFSLGLGVSGMTQPQKVIGFLDVFGSWDPSLAFVMIGAISVHLIGFNFVTKRPSPLFANSFQIPSRRDLDSRLILGSAIFGVGWGIAGYCPGPAITSLIALSPAVLVFLTTMVAGMYLHHLTKRQ